MEDKNVMGRALAELENPEDVQDEGIEKICTEVGRELGLEVKPSSAAAQAILADKVLRAV